MAELDEAALDELFRVEPVVVTGRRSEEASSASPVAVEVIDRQQIVTSGARDAAQVLSTVAGVQIDSSFAGQSLRMGGLDPQHVLLLVDGERLVGARDGALDLTRFFASDIERIEIVRGPASALYGSDAMAGVVNIITRPTTERLEGEALGRYGATAGSDGAGKDLGHHGEAYVSAGAGTTELRGRVAASYRRQAGFDLRPETLATTGSDSTAYGAQARLDWLPNDALRVPVSVRVQRRDQGAIDESGSGAVYDRDTRTDDVAVVIAPRLQLAERQVLVTSASYAFMRSQYARDQRGDDDGDSYEDGREQLGTLRAQHEVWLSDQLLLTTGLELLGQRYDSPRLSKVGERGRLSPYGQLDVTLSDRPRVYSVLVPSVRVDFDSQYGTNVSPRLALRVDPLKGLITRAALGRGFRAPSFTELLLDFQNPSANYRVSGNPALSPESSLGMNLEVELSRFRGFDLVINLYRNEVHDLIDTALVAVEGGEQRFSYVNVARARTQGVETTLRIHPAPWLTTDLTYTLTHARDLRQKRALPGRSLQRGSARVVLGGGALPWTASLRAVVAGKSHVYADDDAGTSSTLRRAGYVVLDARVAYRFAFVEPFVSGENLTNVRDGELSFRPTTLFVGLGLFQPAFANEAP